MQESDRKFTGSIPDIYDDDLVPLIFESFAEDMASRVVESNPADVLETAAGSGVVTRALAPLLSATARYAVTDLNQPMLDRAAHKQPEDGRITWQQADAMNLPMDDQSFDAVLCQFGVMFFPDKPAGYREVARVLRPGGTYVFNVWDRIEDNVFADSVTSTVGKIFPDDPPLFLARTPHGYHDVEEIDGHLRDAGFRNVRIDTIAEMSTAPSAISPARAYCMGTPLRNELEARTGDLAEVTERAAADIAHVFGDGPVSGKIQGHVVTATK